MTPLASIISNKLDETVKFRIYTSSISLLTSYNVLYEPVKMDKALKMRIMKKNLESVHQL